MDEFDSDTHFSEDLLCPFGVFGRQSRQSRGDQADAVED
jgi:hypothetical protein